MRKIIWKDLIREIRHSFGRFISIFGIVLVGVAFFTGVKASAPYMKASADSYFDRSDFYDLRIFSREGITPKDISNISKTNGIDYVHGAYMLDVLTTIETSEHVVQMMSIGDNEINSIRVTRGRLPEKTGECVLRDYEMKELNLDIGDKISVYSGNRYDIDMQLITDTYTIVGYVTTPYYLSYQYDSTSIGSGDIDTIMFVKDENFLLPAYTVAYAEVTGAKDKNTYNDDYFELIEPVKEKLITDGYLVYDRNSHFSYVDYGNCSDRMNAIASVFPVFFYLVAALVCLTTMTRMIDEQRGNIGTMKALGYGKATIAFKYVMYAFSASLLGGTIGCLAGLEIFPKVIFNAWGIIYTVDKMTSVPQTILCVCAVGVAVIVTVAAAILACSGELMETPALLLRPKAPKIGKKVFLERITFIWKHFSFLKKVAARNILRYKKRFFMTVTGIAGCTALILAGFGIKNSVSMVVSEQYGKIFGYDMDGSFTESINEAEFYDYCNDNEQIENAYIYSKYSMTAEKNPESDSVKEKDITLISVDDKSEYDKFTGLFCKESGKRITIPEEGALITYKMAKDFGIKKGDTIYVKYNDEYYPVMVSDIVKMYIRQYIFIQDDYFEQVFGEDANHQSFMANLYIDEEKEQEQVGKEIIDRYEIESITYYSGIQDYFNDMISSLDIITVVLIVSAALLAFVVLYNLINVNVSERIREIATIKVLGFYNTEVAVYVYRENIILTIIGAIAGLVLGIFLHGYIMNVIEMDDVIFPKAIFWYSYIYSFVITVIFGIVVNLIMYGKLKKIPMVESLKSVE